MFLQLLTYNIFLKGTSIKTVAQIFFVIEIILKIQVILGHLKLWIALARHLMWVKNKFRSSNSQGSDDICMVNGIEKLLTS